MPLVLRCFVAGFCLLLFFVIIRLVMKERMLLEYSLLWLILALALFFSALFPDVLFFLSAAFGFIAPVNFVFFIGLFCLLAIALSLTLIVSRQAIKIKNLVQRLAILEYKFEHDCESDKLTGDKPNASF